MAGKTLKELGVKPGDVVAYCGVGRYTVSQIEGHLVHSDGVAKPYHHWNTSTFFNIVSRANNRDPEASSPYGDNNHPLPPMKEETPTLFGNLSNEEKGRLLLAHHNKEKIQVYQFDEWMPCSHPSFYESVSYRIKPAPVVEKKRGTMVFHDGVPVEGSWRSEEDIMKQVDGKYV